MHKTPALNRLGYIYDYESARLVRNDKRGRKMPRKMVRAALDAIEAKRASMPKLDEELLPF